MIPFDFDYFNPETVQEAYHLYHSLTEAGREPVYFSGGTEIITLGRIHQLYTDAVIDLKGIPECRTAQLDDEHLYLGAALPLTAVEEARLFPLLMKNVKEIADHTAREKVTLGGNICGNIFYREAVLPFLLSDSSFAIAGKDGLKVQSIHDVFEEHIQLAPGEFLVQTITEKNFLTAPHVNIKRKRQWDTGYPVVTVAAAIVGRRLRIGISGLCPFPFRSYEVEAALNEPALSPEQKAELAISHMPAPILNDSEASAEYRLFVLKNTLTDILVAFEGMGRR